MTDKPVAVNSAMARELDKMEQTMDAFAKQANVLDVSQVHAAPKQEREMQVPMSDRQIAKTSDVYLKPTKSVPSKEKFNERFRDEYNFQKEYVQFIAENSEIKGDVSELWTKPFPGMPAEFWLVPPNKPVWAPRYVAEQIKRCSYRRLKMDQRPISADGMGTYFGEMVQDTIIQRLDARPITNRKSVFMGASGF